MFRQSYILCRELTLLLFLIGLVSSSWAQEQIRVVPFDRAITPERLLPTDKLTLALKANPERVTAGSMVRFDVTFNTDTLQTPVVYSLWINGTETAQWRDSSSYTHRFEKPGTFEALVTAKIGSLSSRIRVVRSNGVRVAVLLPPTRPQVDVVRYLQPKAKIFPETQTLTQGQEARFQASHAADSRLKVETRWDGPAGPNNNPDIYVVQTRNLAPGTYTIHYRIRDSKSQEAEAQAELHVVAVNYERPRASILPETLTLTQGEEARFQASHHTDDRLKIVDTRWEGPAGTRNNTGIYIVPTGELGPGTYAIHYYVRDTRGQVAETQAELHVVAVNYERPRASILPETLTLTQGEEARFQASYHTDGRLKIVNTRWDGPAGASNNTGIYAVPTGKLEPGTYAIHYHVRDTRGQVAEAQAELHVVAVDYEQPYASILPETLTLTQGEEARFQVRYHTDSRLKIVEIRWDGPVGVSDNPEVYVVPTGDQKPGTYTIHCHISDTRGQVADAKAELHIVEAFRPLSADIFPKTLSVTQGQTAQFRATYNADPRLNTKSLWDGPAGESGNPDTYIVPTHDLAPGTYTVHYQIHDSQGREVKAESVLHVRAIVGTGDDDIGPLDGKLIWVLWGGGALAVGLGLGWWLRLKVSKPEDSKQKLKSQTGKLTVKVDPKYELWRGGFEETPDASPRIRLALVADLGNQTWGDTPNTSPNDRGTYHD